MLKVIFFDFDGVIIESAEIKSHAFQKLFDGYPNFEEIVRYLEKHPGVSRYEKFEHIYKNILKQEFTVKKKEELSSEFSKLVLDEIKICPFVKGTLVFLDKYSKKVNLFIISATPDEELKFLVKEKDLGSYFSGIYGAPAKKSDIMLQIMKNNGISNSDVLFVGDAISDYEHAKKAEVNFVGRLTGDKNPFPADVKLVGDLNELATVVEGML